MMSVKDENELSALSSGADAFLNKQASADQVLNLLQKHLRV
jgi:CheY-like chemotaxis protein